MRVRHLADECKISMQKSGEIAGSALGNGL
jgi:hypothetical protein